MTIRFLQKLYE